MSSKPTVPAAIAGIAIALVLGIVSVVIYPLYFTSLGALLIPLVVALYFLCGIFAAILAMALLALAGYLTGGAVGLLLALLAVVPSSTVIMVLLRRKASVHYAVYYGSAVMISCLLMWYSLSMLLTGGDLIESVVADIASSYDQMYREIVAAQGIPQDGSLMAYFSADYFPVEEFTVSLKSMLLPQIARISCLGAFLGATVPCALLGTMGKANMVSLLSPMHTWRLPRKIGNTLIGTYLAFMALMFFGVNGAETVMQTVWQTMQIVYSVVCLSYIAADLRHKGYSPGTRTALFILFLGIIWLLQITVIFASLPILFGIFSDMVMMRNIPRVMGDSHGPFGPPDRPRERNEANGG